MATTADVLPLDLPPLSAAAATITGQRAQTARAGQRPRSSVTSVHLSVVDELLIDELRAAEAGPDGGTVPIRRVLLEGLRALAARHGIDVDALEQRAALLSPTAPDVADVERADAPEVAPV